MIDVMVVSHACIEPINRIPHRRMLDLGWKTEIVTANRLKLGGLSMGAVAVREGDPPMHFLPLRGKSPRTFRFEGLIGLLESRRPRVILLDYDPGSLAAIEVGCWARARKAHVVCFSYDNLPRTVGAAFEREGLRGAFLATFVQGLSHLARPLIDHVFVLSDDSRSTLTTLGFGGRTTKIPLGFDPTKFRSNSASRMSTREQLGLTEVTVAYFGRLVPEKGVHLLLEALARLSHLSWQLLLDRFGIYEHPYTRELDALIDRLNLRPRVVFFDAPHDDMPKYMNAADVVVLPSISTPRWREQYGRVAPEAMACGRLVVASTSGALPELVGDRGLLVPPNDIDALGDAIRRAILDGPLREELGARAEQYARENLSLRRQVEVTDQLFRRWASPSGDVAHEAPSWC